MFYCRVSSDTLTHVESAPRFFFTNRRLSIRTKHICMSNEILLLLAAGAVFGVYALYKEITRSKKTDQRDKGMKALGLNVEDTVFTSHYISGHPSIDKPYNNSVIAVNGDKLVLLSHDQKLNPKIEADIPGSAVKNIVIEDAKTIQSRVTVGRMLAVGIFAFAWKKKEVSECAYLVIEWNDGRFDHETMFEYAGAGSMTKANKARNKLIKGLA